MRDDILEALRKSEGVVFETTHVLMLVMTKSLGHWADTNHEDYRKVLRTLHKLQNEGLVKSYSTTMNNRVWWLTERVVGANHETV